MVTSSYGLTKQVERATSFLVPQRQWTLDPVATRHKSDICATVIKETPTKCVANAQKLTLVSKDAVLSTKIGKEFARINKEDLGSVAATGFRTQDGLRTLVGQRRAEKRKKLLQLLHESAPLGPPRNENRP